MFLAAQSGNLFAGGGSSHECTQRFSRLTSQLFRGQNFQSRKILRKIFQNFCLECFGGLPQRLARDLIQLRKTRVLHFKDSFILKLFSFPSNILSVHCPLSLTHRISHLNHHFHHLLNFNLQKKVWVFLFSQSILCLLSQIS